MLETNTVMNNVPLLTAFASAERDTYAQLREQQQLLGVSPMVKTLLAAIPEIVLILNQQRQIVFANETCLNIFGVQDFGQMIGKRPGELLSCTHSDEMPGGCGTSEFCRTCGAVRAILTSLKGNGDMQECRISLINGDALDLRVWATPLSVDGQIFSVFSLRDISDEKRRSALERIFFHDVLNTAGIVTSYSQLIKRFPARSDEFLGRLDHAANRLVDEIQAQHQLMLAESGELAVSFSSLPVNDFLSGIGREYADHQISAEKTLRIDLPEQPVSLTTDVALLGRVIENMVKNALEACQAGDTVTIGYTTTADRITFTVHNPVVMSRKVQLQVFNRSFSTKGGGRGLGTYSMKLLSERYLHGRVYFVSDEGVGTTFYAEYPLQ